MVREIAKKARFFEMNGGKDMKFYRCDYCGEIIAENEIKDEIDQICPKCGNGDLEELCECAKCGWLWSYKSMFGDPDSGDALCLDCFDLMLRDPDNVSLFLFDNDMTHEYAEWCAKAERRSSK